MNPTRDVLVHRRLRTVHELRSNGLAYCGNGNNRPEDYDRMQADEEEHSGSDGRSAPTVLTPYT